MTGRMLRSNWRMKLVLLISGLGLSLVSSPAAAASVKVTQIQFSPNPVLRDREIKNIALLDRIQTAGRYAWAVGDKSTKVAFYDGHQWQTATAIGSRIDQVKPLYPDTGEQPLALMRSTDGDLQLFDGAHWGLPFSPISVLGFSRSARVDTCGFSAAGGFAYVYCKNELMSAPRTFVYAVYSSKTGSWSTPTTVPADMELDEVDTKIGNDAQPSLFLAATDSNDDRAFEIVQISPDGSYHIMPLTTDQPGSSIDILLGKNHVFAALNKKSLWVFDAVKNTGWTSYPTPFSPETSFYLSMKDNENDDVLCLGGWAPNGAFIAGSSNRQPQLLFSCLDAKSATPTWTPVMDMGDSLWTWHHINKRGGAWLALQLSAGKTRPRILDYELSTNSLKDTGFVGWTRGQRNSLIEAIEPNALLVCQYVPNANPSTSLYYYNGDKSPAAWLTVEATSASIRSNCNFSYGSHWNMSDGSNLWLYRDSSDHAQKALATNSMRAREQRAVR